MQRSPLEPPGFGARIGVWLVMNRPNWFAGSPSTVRVTSFCETSVLPEADMTEAVPVLLGWPAQKIDPI